MIRERWSSSEHPIRYAVVGLGHIAQTAILPAFRYARANSTLTALVSGDVEKRSTLGEKYCVQTYGYDEYDACLENEDIDAVFIALPNHLHCEYTVRAAEAGKHVLCEKPMAVDEAECLKMIEAAKHRNVRLMIAYRLHFEQANLSAIELAQGGDLGDLRFYDSSFCMQVREGNIRTQAGTGEGTLYDIGIYCINAARYLFRDEPIEVFAFSANNGDPRFAFVEEMTSAILRFPKDRLATFTCSFGATDISTFRIVGTKGTLRLDPAYDFATRLRYELTVDGKTRKHSFLKRDQFAAEIIYFSERVRDGKEPEPSGAEGLADVRVIEALYRSAKEGRPVKIDQLDKAEYPSREQEIDRPSHAEPEVIHAASSHY